MCFINAFKNFVKNRAAVVTLEYALGLGLLVIACVGGINEMKKAAQVNMYCTMPDQKKIHETICKEGYKKVESNKPNHG